MQFFSLVKKMYRPINQKPDTTFFTSGKIVSVFPATAALFFLLKDQNFCLDVFLRGSYRRTFTKKNRSFKEGIKNKKNTFLDITSSRKKALLFDSKLFVLVSICINKKLQF